MIIGFCCMFILFGTCFMLCQYYMPPVMGIVMSLQMMGAMFVAIGLVVLSGNFLGDWLRDKLDPRLRQL